VLHGSRASYVAAVGRGSERTVGSSLVKVDGERITKRRIDLVGSQTAYLTAALPHELTHVILKERFRSTPLPRWADEGIAILADTKAKQSRHFDDLKNALVHRTAFRAGSLLLLDDYPRLDQFGTFYGQSASLAEFLVSQKNPRTFLEFIERANTVGYDAALEQYYGIAGVSELDRRWREHLASVGRVSAHGG
jgi:hypothetical protein